MGLGPEGFCGADALAPSLWPSPPRLTVGPAPLSEPRPDPARQPVNLSKGLLPAGQISPPALGRVAGESQMQDTRLSLKLVQAHS